MADSAGSLAPARTTVVVAGVTLATAAVAAVVVASLTVPRWVAVTLGATAVAAAAVLLAGSVALRRGSRRAASATRASARTAAARIDELEEETGARDAVLSAMTEGVLLFDPSGRLAYANQPARAMLGRRFDAASELSPRALRDAVLHVRTASAGTATPRPQTNQLETADALIEATALPADPPGTVVVILRDVTTARAVERLRRDFVTNASHELKTPVASILALSETLRQAAGDDPEAVDRFLSRLEREATRLAQLVGDLLELSRLEGAPPEPVDVRLDLVVADEAERLRPRALGAGLRLRVDSEGPVTVSGSPADLALLVHNLLDNAIRYTTEGGEVRVALARGGGVAELTVDDTGIGIPSRDLQRVFERFYRVDAARSRETGGTGLGLAIVRHVADAHRGSVEVRSVLGAGSTFVVRLPLAAGVAAPDVLSSKVS